MANRHKKPTRPRAPHCDYHHIFFQGRHYKQGYAKALRDHPYCGGYIPQQTLHREIHSKIHDVPTPNGADCRMAIEALNSWLAARYISLDDPIERKIEVLCWCFRVKCPATTAMLEWQGQVITKFYNRRG